MLKVSEEQKLIFRELFATKKNGAPPSGTLLKRFSENKLWVLEGVTNSKIEVKLIYKQRKIRFPNNFPRRNHKAIFGLSEIFSPDLLLT